MADFYTNHLEELLIDRIRKNGFGYEDENEFPKYLVLRVALACGLNAPLLPLANKGWEDKRISDNNKGKEYHLGQITGKGKDEKEDFDLLIRSMLYIKHKAELDRDKKDIFKNEKEYLKILKLYLQRGLYELHNTYKSSDCFYQWCLDNLHLSFKQEGQIKENDFSNDIKGYFDRVQNYFKKEGIDIELINEADSYRHHICKIELLDSTKIPIFKKKCLYLDDELGESIYIESCKGMGRVYSIQIPKPEKQWQKLGLKEFEEGLSYLQKQNYALGVFAGMSVDKEPFCFDLKDTPHLFVAGTTGGGKSVLLKSIILCLAQNKNVEIAIIDPKAGGSFKEFKGRKNLDILSAEGAKEVITSLVSEMEERYKRQAAGESYESMPYKILIIDELADLFGWDPEIQKTLIPLAIKARECKIHLILATQRPDSGVFNGQLRSNIPSRIALKVQKSAESKIILDEAGAEKLTGKGDMLVKTINGDTLQRVLGVHLKEEEIKSLLKF
ncbi:FtsK/SpoIIIE domain-containing protein [Helicobacter mesocricetorum]|uniref:FtsK/SpoIIIE domain-containing protein n=1 Tax=Helicobacter mesocricetorum TaxID=87012 RepID=UPI000CF1951E|nr:FtsK/SpoIIIE domain-containing protein [Helicobacter mesocricetorum]